MLIKDILKKIIPLQIRIKLRDRLNASEHALHRAYKFFVGYKFSKKYDEKYILSEINEFPRKPLISIVILNPGQTTIFNTLETVYNQFYTNIELIVVADKKEALEFTKKNTIAYQNISGNLNDMLLKATGEYIGILYAPDELTLDALYELTKTILGKSPDVLYTDNDTFYKKDRYINPNYKPDFSPFTLLSQNYIDNFCLFKTTFLRGFLSDEPLENIEHYDLILKATEKTNKIVHLPKILYHKYVGPYLANNTVSPYENGSQKRTVEEALKRRTIKAELIKTPFKNIIRVKRTIEGNPKVSIIIPFKDKPDLLDVCLKSIVNLSSYQNFEIIGISNNSVEEKTFALMERYSAKDSRIVFYENNIPFNFSTLNNFAVSKAKGEQIILLNNDIEIISKDWIEALLEYSQLKEVGVVGAKLYYPNNKIQHAGIIIGLRGLAGHSHKMADRADLGYQGRLNVVQNISGVTAACVMLKKQLYLEVGGLEEKLKVAFNDVDLCLKIQEKGYMNIFTPYCEAYHYESITRGVEDSFEKIARIHFEMNYIKNRYRKILEEGDPYYNLNLTDKYEDFSVK
ncbi:MAG TPA: glycosyltransferase [Cytophagaceae bacterium]|jgi:GT2 family glycosyltransferase|nr:glycosyltransferase [Cytophagaceae bacterium]